MKIEDSPIIYFEISIQFVYASESIKHSLCFEDVRFVTLLSISTPARANFMSIPPHNGNIFKSP